MDLANGVNDDPIETVVADPLAGTEEAPIENGKPKSKRGRKPGIVDVKKRKKNKSGIIKVVSKRYKAKAKQENTAGPDPDDDGEYEVEAIVDHKKEKGKTVYRIRWKGYSQSQDSWLPGPELGCKDLLKRYKKKIEKETKDVYVVSKIIDHRRSKGTTFYRVRWENYSSKDDTWQAKESLSCNELLKEYHDNLNQEILSREEAKLKAQVKAKSSNNEYEVESIMNKKTIKGKVKYLIRWKGWEESDDTWEPEETLSCPELIKAFNKKGKVKTTTKVKGKKRKRDDSEASDNDSDDSDYGGGKKSKGGGEYEVEKVLNSRINKAGKWEFFVMWKGYGPEENTWEPESNLNCTKLINQFLGKDKVPLAVRAKLEKVSEQISAPAQKKERKPPTERSTSGGLKGRTKGARKVLG